MTRAVPVPLQIFDSLVMDITPAMRNWMELVARNIANLSTGSGGSLTTQDEGVTLSAAATTLNFTGTGVTASGAATTVVFVGGADQEGGQFNWGKYYAGRRGFTGG